MKRKIISETNSKAWTSCSVAQVIRMLGTCNNVKQELKNNRYIASGRLSIYDAYRDLAERYRISVRSYPVYLDDTDSVIFFTFDYSNRNGQLISSNEEYSTLSKAQLRSIHETMYVLEEILSNKSRSVSGRFSQGINSSRLTGMVTYSISRLHINESPYYDTVSWNDGNNHASKDGQRTTDERSKS